MCKFDIEFGNKLRKEGLSIPQVSARIGCCVSTGYKYLTPHSKEEISIHRRLGQMKRRLINQSILESGKSTAIKDCNTIDDQIRELEMKLSALKSEKKSIMKKFKITARERKTA